MNSPPRGPNARTIAWRSLKLHSEDGTFVSDELNRIFNEHQTEDNEKRLAMELASGVIRRRRTLDRVLRAHLSRPDKAIESDLRSLLQLGIYQLVFTAIPAYAAVNETIRVARQSGNMRWVKFMNAVLRGVDRSLTDEFTGEPAANAIPIETDRHRICQKDIFAPLTETSDHLADAFSFPGWLIGRLRELYDEATLRTVLFWFNQTPPLSLRVNHLQTTREKYLQQLADAEIVAIPGQSDECIVVQSTRRVSDLPGFAEGLVSVQDDTAMHASRLLAPQAGERILDLCAAPGSKTCHLAELSQDAAEIIACDVSSARLLRLDENVDRLKLSSIRCEVIAKTLHNLPEGPFDAILLDVPCSNTGVLGRRPEARWRLSEDDISDLRSVQLRLVLAASQLLLPGGRIVYSTCSIDRTENEDLVEAALSQLPEFSCTHEQRFIPGQPADGGYQALLKHTPSTSETSHSPAAT